MDQQAVPSWLLGFLEPAKLGDNPQPYFAECKEHVHHNAKSRAPEQNASKKAGKNYYCVNCVRGPFCQTAKAEHRGHRVLQVRKSSNVDAIRISDISRLVNIDYIQTYNINGAKIVMLPSRPQIRPRKGSPSYCEECTRSLADQGVRFCSLTCKMITINKGRPKDQSLRMAGGMRSGEEQSSTSGDSLLQPGSLSPAGTVKKGARSYFKKKSFGPRAARPPSPTSLLLSHPDHHTDVPKSASAASAFCEDSSSQNALKAGYVGFRKRSRKGVPTPALGVAILSENELQGLEGVESLIDLKHGVEGLVALRRA